MLFSKKRFPEKKLLLTVTKNKLRTGEREGILGSRNKGDEI